MGLDNTRAFFLLEGNKKLDTRDKNFLETHIKVYTDLVNTLEGKILSLKDTIDYGKYLNNEVLAIKENLIKAAKEMNSKEAVEHINRIFLTITKGYGIEETLDEEEIQQES